MLINILADGVSSLGILVLAGVSIILGLLIALTHKATSRFNKNFLTTLAMLPLLVMSVIMVVNGNLGMSVAVAGTFGLIRFRSVPGTSKEILSVFFAMAVGLALGAGYIIMAPVVTIIGCLFLLLLHKITLFDKKASEKFLRITIPENLDYTDVFDEILKKYTKEYSIMQVKTTNLGSMFELKYSVNLKDNINEKEFLDELRVKNGNLKINLTTEVLDVEL